MGIFPAHIIPTALHHFSVFLVLFLVILAGCKPSEDQILFEQEAFRPPSNITTTNERGIVQSEDPDDWRIAPMFYRLVRVNPIFPNPTSGNDLRLQIYIERTEAVFGMEIVRIDPRNYPHRFISLYRNNQAPMQPGMININIPFQVMFPQHPGYDERGIHRILIYDGRNNLISYGDVRLD